MLPSPPPFPPDGYLDINDPLMVTAPMVDPGTGYKVINEYNPLVYLGNARVGHEKNAK